MGEKSSFSPERLHYLGLLAKQYPNIQAAGSEIINLQAIMNLPKGTEHFISDIHGEHEAFQHILTSCSGEVRRKLDELFGTTMTRRDLSELATLIYYPEEKLAMIAEAGAVADEYYRILLHRLVEVGRYVTKKYTRSKVRKALPEGYAYILDELLHIRNEEDDKRDYYENIIASIIATGQAPDLILALCTLIKRMTVDHLHIVGDIFDRGPRADIVMDALISCHSVDIQWGNHDILWMGAASGSRTMVATVLANTIRYNNMDIIETGYGISLRPLAMFADDVYRDCDTHQFKIKFIDHEENNCSERDKQLSSRMYKAISMIMFKLEGQKIMRHPEYGMDDRLLLDKVDYENKCITIDGTVYAMEDCDFPTVDPKDPYTLTREEEHVIRQLTHSFRHSEKLQQHTRYLYSKGGLYKVHNGNLLFHGCIPMDTEGNLMEFNLDGKTRSGKAFLDYAEQTARRAYYDKRGTEERQFGMDFLWWLWAGRNSPIFGKDRMTTFERRFILDETSWYEQKNPYYTFYNDPAVCDMILGEFGLHDKHSHIINGHVPVRAGNGESPIKADGKLIVIDGGFCRAYQKTSGIAGYTLIYNSHNFRMVSHQPFKGRRNAILNNQDIANDDIFIEHMETRVKVGQTDIGKKLQAQIDDLMDLLAAYRSGAIKEDH